MSLYIRRRQEGQGNLCLFVLQLLCAAAFIGLQSTEAVPFSCQQTSFVQLSTVARCEGTIDNSVWFENFTFADASSNSGVSQPQPPTLFFAVNIHYSNGASLTISPLYSKGLDFSPVPSESGWQYIPSVATVDGSTNNYGFWLSFFSDVSCDIGAECLNVSIEVKWESNYLATSGGALDIQIETSQTYLNVELPASSSRAYLPIQVSVVNTNDTGEDIPWAEIKIYNSKLPSGIPIDGLYSITPYAIQTVRTEATVLIYFSDWSLVKEIFVQLVPLRSNLTATLNIAQLPDPNSFGSWALAPMVFIISASTSLAIILCLPKIVAKVNLPDRASGLNISSDAPDRSPGQDASGNFRNARGIPVLSRVDWSLATFFTAVFFIVPALQMIGEDLVQYAGGNRDICYFNEKCQYPHPISTYEEQFWALNNVASNLGYIFVGLVLGAHFAWVQLKWSRVGPSNPAILYAIAVALVLEGVCSGLYHLCPSVRNFQVDTVFMFVICALSVAETLRKHLGDLSPIRVFTLLSLLIILNYIGTLFWSGDRNGYGLVFRLSCTVVLAIIYGRIWYFTYRFNGDWTYYLLHGIGFTLSVVVVFSAPNSQVSAAMLLLAILIITGALSQFADVLRVSRAAWKTSGMKAWRFFLLWGTLGSCATLCWIVALYYFIQVAVTDKETSPWVSRELNKGCTVGYYDNHDVWHFVSALALFFQTLLSFHFQFPRKREELNLAQDGSHLLDPLVVADHLPEL